MATHDVFFTNMESLFLKYHRQWTDLFVDPAGPLATSQ